ncbi:M48 family metallopeptidase [Cellvibrio sp.]|uniref:M48 family metallopeptidase n=1 Tax=Cellvibrio sp. TaxID=1965322 RepID=UPI003964778A
MVLQGIWFDGKTSASQPVELRMNEVGTISVIRVSDQTLLTTASITNIDVKSRVGNTPRYIYFPDGEKCETRDHAVVDRWLKQYRPSIKHSLAHSLESHSYFVALTLVLVIAFSWVTVVYGLPAASRYIAYHLPEKVMDRAATETLQFLDKVHLKPTSLDEETRARILKHFAPAIAQNSDLRIKIIFRGGGDIGANAFALPDGTVLFTDEIVHLAKNDDELLSVLAHEIGHVKYRHSLRSVIQGSVISFAVAMVTGDVSAASNLLASLPVVFTTLSYSRDFEREADNNSLLFLDANHIERHYFVDLMERLSYQVECSLLLGDKGDNSSSDSSTNESAGSSSSESGSVDKKEAVDKKEVVDKKGWQYVEAHREECDKLMASRGDSIFDSKVLGYFSSHPQTKERTAKFKQPSAPTPVSP